MAIFEKKTRVDSDSKWKICLYFYSKMLWDQDIRLLISFSSYPFGGILDTFPLLRFQFCFFTNNQLLIYLSIRELISKKICFLIRLNIDAVIAGIIFRKRPLWINSLCPQRLNLWNILFRQLFNTPWSLQSYISYMVGCNLMSYYPALCIWYNHYNHVWEILCFSGPFLSVPSIRPRKIHFFLYKNL